MRSPRLPLLLLSAAAIIAGCGATARFTRPDGDGGWSAEQRAEAVDRAARASDAAPLPPIDEEPPAPGTPLSLREALRLAVSHNRPLAASRLRLEVERQRVYEVRGRLLPTTIGAGRYTWFTDAQSTAVELPPGILPPGTVPPEVEVRDREAGTLNGTLTQPLDLAGELRYALAAAQAGYRGEAARNWANRLEQHALTIEAYFQLLEAERLHEVIRQTIALHREQLSHAQERYDNGRLTKNELLVVQVALTDSEQQLVRIDLTVDRARWALNQVVGIAVAAPTEAEDVRDRPEVPATDEAIAIARRRNPVLAALLEEQQRLEATITSLKRSRFPRFFAGGAIDYSTSDILQPQEIASGFVGFNWDLGTDTQREARIAAAQRSAEVNRVNVEHQVRELEEAVRDTQRGVLERLSAFDSATTAVGQAEENLRIRRQQFDAGRATSEDVLDAQALLTRQRAVAATALYEAHSRRARLQQLMGAPMEELLAGEESR